MSAFKSRRAKLLLLVVLVSVLLIWRPWGGLEPKLRGIKLGPDIVGGSRTILGLEGTRIMIQATAGDDENLLNNLLTALETNLETNVMFVDYDPNSGGMVFDVNRFLTLPVTQRAIEGLGTVLEINQYVAKNTVESTILSLGTRIDPYEILDTQFSGFGKTSIVFESYGLSPEYVEDLLAVQGKLEIVIDNQVVLGNDDVEIVGTATSVGDAAYVPVALTKSGVELLKSATNGKVNHAIVIYLDRPFDSILVFDNRIMQDALELSYSEKSKAFQVTYEQALNRVGYFIAVNAVPINRESVPRATLDYLEEQVSAKTKIILLGAQTDFSAEVIQDISAKYKITFSPKRNGESVDGWILRVCGVESTPIISQIMAAGGVSNELTFPFIERTRTAAFLKAQNFQKAISTKLAVPISFEYETTFGPRFGGEFVREALVASGVSVILAMALIYLSFKRFRIAISFLSFAFVDAIITSGIISLYGLSLGLPELAGLLFVVLTGFNQNLIVTSEMLKGVKPQEKVSVGWRASRAMSVVYIAILTTICVAALTIFLGFGAIRTFAMVAASGLIIAMLLTRPVFSLVIESILTSGSWAATSSPPKLEQKQG